MNVNINDYLLLLAIKVRLSRVFSVRIMYQ